MVMKSLGDDFFLGECKKMIGGVDSDGDGIINFEEFRVMMMVGLCFNVIVKDWLILIRSIYIVYINRMDKCVNVFI